MKDYRNLLFLVQKLSKLRINKLINKLSVVRLALMYKLIFYSITHEGCYIIPYVSFFIYFLLKHRQQGT